MVTTTVPSAGSKVFWGASVTITNASYTFAAIAKCDFDWGYKIQEEPVTGSNMPYFGTGVFSGKMTVDGYASSDEYVTSADIYKAMVDIDSTLHAVADATLTITMKDEQATQGKEIWTVVGKPSNIKFSPETDKIVKFAMKVTLTALPTVSAT